MKNSFKQNVLYTISSFCIVLMFFDKQKKIHQTQEKRAKNAFVKSSS